MGSASIQTGNLGKPIDLFKDIIKFSNDLVWMLDGDCRLTFINEHFEEFIGLKEEDCLGNDFLSHIVPNGILEFKKIFSNAYSGKTVQYNLDLLLRDGSIFNTTITTIPLYEKDQVQGLLSFGSNIKERSTVTIEPPNSETQYQALFEEAPNAVVLADASGVLLKVNNAACQMFGYTEDELVGKNLSKISYPEDMDRNIEKRKQLLFDNIETFRMEKRYIHKKGHVVWGKLSVTVIDDLKAHEPYLIGHIEDITEQKLAEDERNRYRELSSVLNDINQSIHSSLDFEEIIRRLVAEACKTLGDSVGLLVRDDRYWVAKHFQGELEEITGKRFTEYEAKAATIAEKTLRPVVSNNVFNDDRFNENIVKKYNCRSIMVVPLVVKDRVVGALYFIYNSSLKTFKEPEIDFGIKLASTVSLAIENAGMYGSEQYISNTLQEAFLNLPKKLPGIEFGKLYRSASEAAKVGGDFFDLFELKDNRIGVSIGDVSGKGIDAASLATLTKNGIKAYAQLESSPAQVINRTGNLIEKSCQESMFVTTFFGILEIETGKLRYCNAGHSLPLIRKHAGDVVMLETCGVAIGQFSDVTYKESEITLEAGDVLIIYTDGLTEARNRNEFFGEKRLQKKIDTTRSIPIKKLPEAIFKEVESFAGGTFADDIAVLAISLNK